MNYRGALRLGLKLEIIRLLALAFLGLGLLGIHPPTWHQRLR
jgi:hypothetical protein